MPVIKRVNKLTIAQKCEIVEKLDSGIVIKSICQEYHVHKSTITRIKRSKAALRKFITNAEFGPGNAWGKV